MRDCSNEELVQAIKDYINTIADREGVTFIDHMPEGRSREILEEIDRIAAHNEALDRTLNDLCRVSGMLSVGAVLGNKAKDATGVKDHDHLVKGAKFIPVRADEKKHAAALAFAQAYNPKRVDVEMHRPLHTIAREITQDWKKPYFGAVPYLEAMHSLQSMDDKYGLDDADSIVRYFLSNAATWRGDTARRVKKELNAMLKRRP